jgi:hypothetical protein
LEKEAREIRQKDRKNPKPTDKGTIWNVFYMKIKALYKKSGMCGEGKAEVGEAKKYRSKKDNCLRRRPRECGGNLWRTALLGGQVSLKSHGEPAGGTKDPGSGSINRWRKGSLLLNWLTSLGAKLAL